VISSAASPSAPLAFVHRLHPGDRDRAALLDQIGTQLLRLGHPVAPWIVSGDQPRHRAHREVSGRNLL
jgi:hypothetical protein